MTLGAASRCWPITCVIIGLVACGPAGSSAPAEPEAGRPAGTIEVQATIPGRETTYGSLTLAASMYTHSSGSFALYPPEGWPVETDDAGATWTDPNGEGRIRVQVNPTGYELDRGSVDNFVQAIEQVYIESFDGYVVLERSVDRSGAMVVTQSIREDGNPTQFVSVYDQEKDVIYESEFWVRATSVDGYMPGYEQVWRGMEVMSDNASSSIEPYVRVHTFLDPGHLFRLDVPWGWYHDVYTQPEAVADTFSAPDGKAMIEVIEYDDGTVISKALAGAFALDLLHQRYAEDARITDDKVQADGRERLTWLSKNGSQAGVSLFETMGTTFLMVTFMGDSSVDYIYSPVFDRLIQSYVVP